MCVCVLCYRKTSRRSASSKSVYLRITTWPIHPSCIVRRSLDEPGTSASTATGRSWRATGWKRQKELPTSCPNSSKVCYLLHSLMSKFTHRVDKAISTVFKIQPIIFIIGLKLTQLQWIFHKCYNNQGWFFCFVLHFLSYSPLPS